MRTRGRLRAATLSLLTSAAIALIGAGARAADFHYGTPVQPDSPWPTMRRDRFNTAASPIVGRYEPTTRPWAVRTGKGIFSTPIVGADGTIYFGSADTWFYAISPAGKLLWRFKTGNLIDSAGFIGRYDARLKTNPLVVPSGDEYLYEIRSDRHEPSRAARIIWKYKPPFARQPAGQVQLVDWWEGNAEPGPDGTIYAGNTGDAAYAFYPNGTLKWVHRSFGPFWTDPAIGDDGTSYWGSLDLSVHALDAQGNDKWRFPTLGFVVSSPAMDHAGTLYVGSFDSNVYALDTRTGLLKWKFTTGDHVYSSPALDEDAHGNLKAIYIASTDGQVYALSPTGKLLWSYDTGDVIRSSPVVGFAPDGQHKVVYVGAGNGIVYALNASSGTRRWSYDTTRSDPVLRDRNDLNGSPALTTTGVVIGGEDGYMKFVPYDYCLHRRDPRCNTSPGEAFPSNMTSVFAVTPGGNTQLNGGTQRIGSATVLPLRLVVRKRGHTLDASMLALPTAASLVHIDPAVPFTAQLSGDGHYLYVVPEGLLTPGRRYTLHVAGTYTAQGIGAGNVRLGGTTTGHFDQALHYQVAGPAPGPLLNITAAKTSAFGLTRLAFPLPSFVASVNQIGFDAYNLVVGALNVGRAGTDGRRPVLLWAIGARPGPHGTQEVDPNTTLAFPLAGTYRGNSLALSAHNVTLTFSFGPVPVQRLEVRAQLKPTFETVPSASIYGEVNCATVPTYGPLLPTQRLCNDEGKLISSGTFITNAYGRGGTANIRPPGLALTALTLRRPTLLQPGSATATLQPAHGASYRASAHFASIVLADADSGVPVGLDYKSRTMDVPDSSGNIARVSLTIPAGTQMPAHLIAYVVADAFPLATRTF